MNRRGFFASMLALGAAPAIVRADSLMRIVPRETLLYAAPEGTMIVTAMTEITITVAPLLTIDMITREALRVARDNALFIRNVEKTGPWVGDIVRWPKPQKMGDTIRINVYSGSPQ